MKIKRGRNASLFFVYFIKPISLISLIGMGYGG